MQVAEGRKRSLVYLYKFIIQIIIVIVAIKVPIFEFKIVHWKSVK